MPYNSAMLPLQQLCASGICNVQVKSLRPGIHHQNKICCSHKPSVRVATLCMKIEYQTISSTRQQYSSPLSFACLTEATLAIQLASYVHHSDHKSSSNAGSYNGDWRRNRPDVTDRYVTELSLPISWNLGPKQLARSFARKLLVYIRCMFKPGRL